MPGHIHYISAACDASEKVIPNIYVDSSDSEDMFRFEDEEDDSDDDNWEEPAAVEMIDVDAVR